MLKFHNFEILLTILVGVGTLSMVYVIIIRTEGSIAKHFCKMFRYSYTSSPVLNVFGQFKRWLQKGYGMATTHCHLQITFDSQHSPRVKDSVSLPNFPRRILKSPIVCSPHFPEILCIFRVVKRRLSSFSILGQNCIPYI